MGGCGDAAGEPRSAEETAEAWVRAVGERDWKRVCALSTPEVPDCPRQVERSFGNWREPRVERIVTSGPGVPRVEISTAPTRGEGPVEEGWTAYAPLELLLEPHEGGHLVHLELAVIR